MTENSVESEKESGAFCTSRAEFNFRVGMAIFLKPLVRASFNPNSSRRDFFMIVLYCGILGEQYGRQVHLFQKRTCVRKSVS